MRIGVAQTRPVKGDIARNIRDHVRLIELAANEKTELLIFPELSLTGYEPALAESLATSSQDPRLEIFRQLSDRHQLIIGIGLPLKSPNSPTISMLIFQPGQPRTVYSKQFLHRDEEPFFSPGTGKTSFVFCETTIAFAICYELSVPAHLTKAADSGATVYLASAAKSLSGVENALETLMDIARRYKMTVLFSNCTGLCDDFIAAGRSSIINDNGELLAEFNEDDEGVLITDTVHHQIIMRKT